VAEGLGNRIAEEMKVPVIQNRQLELSTEQLAQLRSVLEQRMRVFSNLAAENRNDAAFWRERERTMRIVLTQLEGVG
jgi:conjugal transfer/entry exclusion protein